MFLERTIGKKPLTFACVLSATDLMELDLWSNSCVLYSSASAVRHKILAIRHIGQAGRRPSRWWNADVANSKLFSSQRSWLGFLRRGGCWPKKTWIQHEIFESLESFCLLLLLTTVLMSQSQRYSAKQLSMHWTALFAFLPSSFAFWYPLLHLWKDGFFVVYMLLHM